MRNHASMYTLQPGMVSILLQCIVVPYANYACAQTFIYNSSNPALG